MSATAQERTGSVSHVSLGTNDYPRARAFYDAVLAPLGLRCLLDFPGGAGYGYSQPEFWIQRPHDEGRASAGNGVHVCFNADSVQAVQAFHAAALAHGGTDDGAPGYRTMYAPQYYAAFARDPDGNKIEAMYWDGTVPG